MERKDRREAGGRKGHRESGRAAAKARTQAQESDPAVHGEAARVQPFLPSAELRTLYREVAKRIHPDLATDEADRLKREQLMAEANAAYQKGDAQSLRRSLEYESSPESLKGVGRICSGRNACAGSARDKHSQNARRWLQIARLLRCSKPGVVGSTLAGKRESEFARKPK